MDLGGSSALGPHLARPGNRFCPAFLAAGIITRPIAPSSRTEPRAQAGRQPSGLGSADLWVVPNASGPNAHKTIDSLAVAYGAAARAGGIELVPGYVSR